MYVSVSCLVLFNSTPWSVSLLVTEKCTAQAKESNTVSYYIVYQQFATLKRILLWMNMCIYPFTEEDCILIILCEYPQNMWPSYLAQYQKLQLTNIRSLCEDAQCKVNTACTAWCNKQIIFNTIICLLCHAMHAVFTHHQKASGGLGAGNYFSNWIPLPIWWNC